MATLSAMFLSILLSGFTALVGSSLLLRFFLASRTDIRERHHRRLVEKPKSSEERLRRPEVELSERKEVAQHRHNGDWREQLHKELYHQIQNLEFNPDVLPSARRALFSLLHEGLSIEQSLSPKRSILDVETFSAQALRDFLSGEHESVTNEWECYADRRARGGGPELFDSRDSARKWIKNQAPVKLVDGAWLGHIHKITTPFALRGVTKDAWQVLSEELGDGDLQKNHVFLYANLLKSIDMDLPSSHDIDFIHCRHEMGIDLTWKAGVAQLLISLFPNDFLPEILGFNMHYELLTMETLKAARELPEFGISGYYFALHVSIDNADSGHTAMALDTVIRYLEIVGKQDPSMVAGTWRRIQAGYILSSTSNTRLPLSDGERNIAQLLRDKANASHKIHCSSRVKIGGQTLAQWLSPNNWTRSDDCQKEFLKALSSAKPWVISGQSNKSLLIRELTWNGRMFGAFTNREVEDLRDWIDNLDCRESDHEYRYWTKVGHTKPDPMSLTSQPPVQDIATQHPVYLPQPVLHVNVSGLDWAADQWTQPLDLKPVNINHFLLEALLAIWFTHPCLLENVINTPYRTATPVAAHILKILRAESGFLEEAGGVHGKDEQHRTEEGHSLVSLGLEMNERAGRPTLTDITGVLDYGIPAASSATRFSKTLLSLALRPVQCESLLIGLSLAFLELEIAVAEHDSLLSLEGRQGLQHIIVRKRAAFEDCLTTLELHKSKVEEIRQHFLFGRKQIAAVIN
jgi:hypothetical protein